MKYITALVALAAAAIPNISLAAPTTEPSETQILNFALTLEHLENAFYRQGLANFSDKAFEEANLTDIRGRYRQIAEHEKKHVEFLQKALGKKAVKPCEYIFPVTDVKSLTFLSATLEGVGTSAYTGAAKFLKTPDTIKNAASTLATEARQAAFISSRVLNQNPWNTAFETPLGPSQVISLAAPFIKSCPEDNPPLPFKAFPTLTFPPTARPGENAMIKFDVATKKYKTLYVAFLSGLDTIIVPIKTDNGTMSVEIPSQLLGTSFAVVTDCDEKAGDQNTVAGPAILNFPFDDKNKLIPPPST